MKDITHVVAVTATNAGAPGYDQLVCTRLGIPDTAERVLLSGIGCAGGLAALRVAANMCLAASHMKRPGRALVFATEICSIQLRCEFDAASKLQNPCIGPALFGDGSASLVLCNEYDDEVNAIFSLQDWTTRVVPDTFAEMAYRVTALGKF